MGGIFAIIAIIRQAKFAIVAILFFANIANTKHMKDLHYEDRRWFADQMVGLGHGAKGKIAEALGLSRDAISRIINFKGQGEVRNVKPQELAAAARYFKDLPPSMRAAAKETTEVPDSRSKELVRIPLLDRVAAGKLKAPVSQVAIQDVPLLAFADLGKGDFFALQVEGDSMDRIAPDGAVIVVDQSDRTLVSGKPYVLSDRGAVSFKIWRPNPPRFAPLSTNPSHEPIFCKSKDAAEKMVVGRVKRAVVDL